MKIISINSSDMGGGAERVANQLVSKLNEQKNISCELLVRNKKSNESYVKEIERSYFDKIFTRVYNNFLSTQGKLAIGSKRECEKIVNGNCDIVHLHNIHSNYFNLKNVKYLSDNIPVVWTLHDMWAFTGRCAYAYDCKGWQYECGCCKEKINTFPVMKRDNSKNVIKYKKNCFVSNNIYIVTPSIWLKNLVEKSFMKGMDIRVINNGVDIKLYKNNDKQLLRKRYSLDNEKIYILLASANINDPRKGFRELINNLNKVKNKCKYCILTLGREIESGIISEEYEIKQFGYIKDESKLNEIYSLADVFIMPTLADNFPCTILEAMASGTAVLSYDIGGISEQVTDETGWLIDSSDNRKLIDIINKLNKSICQLKGKAARLRVEQKFTLDKSVNQYINLYNDILKKK